MTEFEKYLQGFVETYYENASETDKETLLNRIVCDAGNKRYVVQEGRRRMADGDEKGDKIYDLSELRDFPDIGSEEFKSNCLDTNSPEHKACEAEIKDLVARFTGNDSKAAADLKALLAHSEIEYRVRKNWTVPNGSCAFQKGENGTPDKIVICISDLKRLKKEGVLSEINEDALPQILAHEWGMRWSLASVRKNGRRNIWMVPKLPPIYTLPPCCLIAEFRNGDFLNIWAWIMIRRKRKGKIQECRIRPTEGFGEIIS